MASFDVSSEVNWQEVDNAINQANKEILQRYDFKGIKTEITLDKKVKTITLICSQEDKLDALNDVLQNKLVGDVRIKEVKYVSKEEALAIYKKATSDNNPDLFFTRINMPMEIKVTSGQVWRGGEFSKRASWHLMVSRNDDFDEFFVCLVDMKGEKDLWISSMQRGKDYYAPSFKKDQIYELKDNKTMLIKESSAPYGKKINQPKKCQPPNSFSLSGHLQTPFELSS